MKIAVGMSGGVDSSVAALLLKNAGNEVYGITMKIWNGRPESGNSRHACYGPGEEDEIALAASVCGFLGIPHFVYDCAADYHSTVIEYFKKEYLAGRTPNPCVICNEKIKFGLLPMIAKKHFSFDKFATGHYAAVEHDFSTGRYLLKKARDIAKDQTYFLHRLSREQLSSLVLPLSGYSKDEVRQLAAEYALPSAEYPESQDFYDGDYREIISNEDLPGEIVDTRGKVLGRHRGLWNFTVGQRKGIGIAYREPLYVVNLDSTRNRVIVGPRRATLSDSFYVTETNWISIDNVTSEIHASVKTRSSQQEVPCSIIPAGHSSVRVEIKEPLQGIAAGQSAVFYDGDAVLGGGIIEYSL